MKRKTVLIALSATLILAALAIWFLKKPSVEKDDPRSVWEAMIQTKGQNSYENPEDQKTFFENGDVIVIFPEGHPWSAGEKSELIIKLKITQEEAEKLMEAETKEVVSDSTEGEGREIGEKHQETVRLRTHRINLDKIGYDGEKPLEEQKLKKEVFEKNVIEKK